jgi:hypothetical protein
VPTGSSAAGARQRSIHQGLSQEAAYPSNYRFHLFLKHLTTTVAAPKITLYWHLLSNLPHGTTAALTESKAPINHFMT